MPVTKTGNSSFSLPNIESITVNGITHVVETATINFDGAHVALLGAKGETDESGAIVPGFVTLTATLQCAANKPSPARGETFNVVANHNTINGTYYVTDITLQGAQSQYYKYAMTARRAP